ncbi:tyrosine-type recombinase/integrase [Rubellimicrobium roseum]|uniref:Site-specific integrase n=1 Tax=Rubellimicrobium roseum TaxID=687525 RepID=A0A5C4NJ60_9RHOB|nr:site-specific integrase [Rubellimicrobium roseum]TNC74142.1 site-specific integrase [Rubellimicrobium roseum]
MPVKLYRRGQIWHYRGTVAGRRLRGSTGTTDKTLAQRIASDAESRAWKGHLDGPAAHLTFAQAAIAYREAEKPTRFLDKIEDHWRDTPVRQITAEAIRQSARKLYPNGKAATRNRQVIKPTVAIINFAAELGWCPPIKGKRFKEETAPKRPATKEWAEAFAAHASPHLGALCLLMLGTGARISEAMAITWGDVDLTRRLVTIRQNKVLDTRIAHLPPPVLAALANIPSNRQPETKVFPWAARDSVRQTWNNVCERAGIERLTPHSCRHGFATTLLRAGNDVKTVAKLGGWKDATTVLRTYAHAIDDPTLTDAIFGTPVTQVSNEGFATYLKGREIS